MKTNATLQQKIKVLNKLFDSGCTTEKELQKLDIGKILAIPGITVPDMAIILELQTNTKSNKLFSYLGGDESERTSGCN